MKQYCQCKRVYPGMKYALPCTAKAKVERDGVLYCGRHDPVTLKAARDKREAVRKLEQESIAIIRSRNKADQARKAALFEALQADRDRLEVMARHGLSVRCDPKTSEWYLVAPYHTGVSCVDDHVRFPTFRAALDEARAK